MNASPAIARTPAEKPLVLVVDSDEDTRALYREWLERNDCQVVEASDGRDALTKALMQPPTLVITEVNLPFINGSALCEILRRDETTRDVPILVVSGALPAELNRARRSGASAVLQKPTTPKQIWDEAEPLLAHGTAGAAPIPPPPPRSAALSKRFSRFRTATPPAAPPALRCPSCDQPLVYEDSYVGGVNEQHREQWDCYACPRECGTFEYRQRTRALRRVASRNRSTP